MVSTSLLLFHMSSSDELSSKHLPLLRTISIDFVVFVRSLQKFNRYRISIKYYQVIIQIYTSTQLFIYKLT